VGIYLSAGVPILGFGHETTSLARMMRQYRLGALTSATGQAELEKFLTDSLRIAEPRAFFREDILQCARTEFNMQQMRNRFWKTLGVRLN
jgi:hypothetical protein